MQIIHKYVSTDNTVISTGFYLKLSGLASDIPVIHRKTSSSQLRRNPSVCLPVCCCTVVIVVVAVVMENLQQSTVQLTEKKSYVCNLPLLLVVRKKLRIYVACEYLA